MNRTAVLMCVSWIMSGCGDDSPSPVLDASASSSDEVEAGACPALDTSNCKSAFGCVGYDSAVTKLEDSCADFTFSARHGQACGYDVVERVYGEGDTLLAFYHPSTGELKGWWNVSDTLEVTCAGAVPPECAKDGGSLTGPNLCADSGPSSSTGSTGSSSIPVEAGPVEAGPIEAGPIEAGPIEAGPIEAGSPEAGTTHEWPDAATGSAGTDSGASNSTPSSAGDASVDASD
jgi:hypothetical protein